MPPPCPVAAPAQSRALASSPTHCTAAQRVLTPVPTSRPVSLHSPKSQQRPCLRPCARKLASAYILPSSGASTRTRALGPQRPNRPRARSLPALGPATSLQHSAVVHPQPERAPAQSAPRPCHSRRCTGRPPWPCGAACIPCKACAPCRPPHCPRGPQRALRHRSQKAAGERSLWRPAPAERTERSRAGARPPQGTPDRHSCRCLPPEGLVENFSVKPTGKGSNGVEELPESRA